jgi:hypothetical protein
MFINDVTNGINIFKQMQPSGDLENISITFDHFKCVEGWTTMACHVYNPEYCNFLSIVLCDMQWKSTKTQCYVQTYDLSNNFKGFMVDGA